ncbi:MAG: hypothetical protein HYZ56_03430 [Nitrosopumilales archaeon]|nr:hypothetical protein [Nitrosopumilales archaeon]
MQVRHLQETDTGYKVFLYIFYGCAFIMTSIAAYGIYAMFTEWDKTGTYIMGEALVKTVSTIVGWYCVTRIGWKKTTNLRSWKMALTQLMVLGFAIVCLYEVLYNFTILNAQIAAGIIDNKVPDIDSLTIAYPDPNRPWNLIFATKVFLAAFIISSHALYLSTRPRKDLRELDA